MPLTPTSQRLLGRKIGRVRLLLPEMKPILSETRSHLTWSRGHARHLRDVVHFLEPSSWQSSSAAWNGMF